MSQIFIANPTLQNRQLQVRVSADHVRIVSIGARSQELFPDDLEGEPLKKVIAQIERAGGVPSSDVKTIRHRFSLLYTVTDRKTPIASEDINKGAKRDQDVRQELAGDALDKGTVAAFATNVPGRPSVESLGGQELSVDITEVSDNGPVEKGANFEVVATKRERRGSRRNERKK